VDLPRAWPITGGSSLKRRSPAAPAEHRTLEIAWPPRLVGPRGLAGQSGLEDREVFQGGRCRIPAGLWAADAGSTAL